MGTVAILAMFMVVMTVAQVAVVVSAVPVEIPEHKNCTLHQLLTQNL
jgi:hypothetical protein